MSTSWGDPKRIRNDRIVIRACIAIIVSIVVLLAATAKDADTPSNSRDPFAPTTEEQP